MKVGGFRDQVSDYQFSKSNSEPWSQQVVTVMKGQKVCSFFISTNSIYLSLAVWCLSGCVVGSLVSQFMLAWVLWYSRWCQQTVQVCCLLITRRLETPAKCFSQPILDWERYVWAYDLDEMTNTVKPFSIISQVTVEKIR